VVPFIDSVRSKIDLRERVVSFPPQPVITEDNLTVNIDTVIFFQVTNPRDATYEISDYIQAVEQLTVTTLRNVVGGMNLEETLTSRDKINGQLRGVLDDATSRWGLRVNRVELKAIDPPASIQDAMEKQMRADRDKRAMILQAEGQRESAIKSAEGQKQAAILSAEGQRTAVILAAEADRQSRILRAEGERAARYLAAQGQAKAIETVFGSIHAADPDPKLLAYQYLQTLPQIAQGDSNKLWIVPSEFGKALDGLAKLAGGGEGGDEPPAWLTAGAAAKKDRPAAEPLDTTDWFDQKATAIPVPPEATSTIQPGIDAPVIPDTRAVAASAVEEVRSAPTPPPDPAAPAAER
jgi:regulator of protease activity HflC (stomatin/prohibitin superfamily)